MRPLRDPGNSLGQEHPLIGWQDEARAEWVAVGADESLSLTYPPVPPDVQAARDAERDRQMREYLSWWRWSLPWDGLDNWKRRAVLAIMEVGNAG